MTKEQITALVRQYAEEDTFWIGYSKEDSEEIIQGKIEKFVPFLCWLHRRYDLTDKTEVTNRYILVKESFEKSRSYSLLSRHENIILDLLKDLFPETTKEFDSRFDEE